MSTVQPQRTGTAVWKFNGLQALILVAAIVVTAMAIHFLIGAKTHKLEICGMTLILLGVAFNGYGITSSFRQESADIRKLEETRGKLKQEMYSMDVVHAQLDIVLDLLISNAKEKRESGVMLTTAFIISLVTSAFGTVFLMYALSI